jgi:putative mRNA 3-end processing factor
MPADFAWLRPDPCGIYIAPADCWIDPAKPMARALVTHGHSDHARGGPGETIATRETLALMQLR